MAYVRKTEILMNGIRDKVRNMRRKAEEMYSSTNIEIGTPIHNAMREALELAAWSEAPELRDKMPKAWCRIVDSARLKFYGHDGMVKVRSVHVSAPDNNKFRLPPNQSGSYYGAEVEVKWDHCGDALRIWLNDDATREKNRAEVATQFDNVERQLMAFMDKHASLNSALKEMPEIEMYVPTEFMDKFHRVEERTVKQKVSNVEEIGIDTDAIASLAIAHRISTSGF